jgi:uncharacterized protein YndB with AHSA1/START domain
MSKIFASQFTYLTYIRSTPEHLWSALTSTEIARQYWHGLVPTAECRVGGAWRVNLPDGRIADTGEFLEFEPPKRLVIRWQHEWVPEKQAEGPSLCTIEVEPAAGEAVKLILTHGMDRPNSKFIAGVSSGWPHILSNLKSLLETGSIVLPPREFR